MTTIITGTYNRAHLLWRSLLVYAKSDVKLIVIDDDSSDNTEELCKLYSLKYIKLPPKNGKWRDSASFLNMGIKIALNELKADHVFITHPEIIPGKETISECVRLATDENTWVSAKGYYLTQEQQKEIDTVDWKADLLNIRKLQNFYGQGSAEFMGNKDYLPESIENIGVWQSWILGGGSKEMWRNFGGLTEFETWGSVDVDLLNRRMKIGMRTVTPYPDSAIVVHQNHDNPETNTLTPRDMDKCLAALPDYNFVNPKKPELIA